MKWPYENKDGMASGEFLLKAYWMASFIFDKGMLQIQVVIHVWSFVGTGSASKTNSVDGSFFSESFFLT